ncbi:long-chain fatty acid--CoA ligase [Robertmurraya kyonggiensis]|uniref:Long-chain fatty acid--CoA ligase n=2 Tax=Robertmurraya kyonggiensis TaxID=1037680 RepID=A0A4U1DA78_9BACI|nr:long-chain fatty acid--CoA ligase [Robertmurraya kyonggiensis]
MNLFQSLERNARSKSNKTAIIFNNNIHTYLEFNEEVNRIAHALINYGVKKGDKISIMMKNSDAFIFVFYGILKAGAVAVPINFRLTAHEVRYILDDSDSVLVFVDEEFAETVAKAREGNEKLQLQIIVGEKAEEQQIRLADFKSSLTTNPDLEVLESDDAEILYTSGTTGLPKGVLLDHHRVLHVAFMMTITMKIGTEDNLLHVAPLFHSAQLNLFLVSGTFLGSTQVVQQDFHPVETLKIISTHKISLFFGVPTMYNFFLQVPKGMFDVSSVTRLGYGAAPMPNATLQKSMEMFNTDQFFNLCGLTEGGPGGIFLTPEGHKAKFGVSGRANHFTDARIVDEAGGDVKPGEVGEFIIKAETIMKEYYKKTEETRKTLKDGWLYTGDLATIDGEGYITLVDRKKDMIISGGENVYSTEVEQVLYKHPDILEAAVIGIPHEVWGETVAAIVVPKENKKIEHENLLLFCRQELAGYKIPRVVYEMEQLPRNASGKVLKYKLRESYQGTPTI